MKRYRAQYLITADHGARQWKNVPPVVGHSNSVGHYLISLVRDCRHGKKEIGVPYRHPRGTYFRLLEII